MKNYLTDKVKIRCITVYSGAAQETPTTIQLNSIQANNVSVMFISVLMFLIIFLTIFVFVIARLN